MRGTKYLSELIEPALFKKDKLNIIKAPTGSGKTYFALTYIPSLVEDALHKVVYLIDTINGKEQILKNYHAVSEYKGWMKDVSEEGIWFCGSEDIVIMTYAKFGILLEKEPNFHTHFEYIICDELHSLIRFQGYSPKPNSHSIANSGLKEAVKNNRTVVIALSATPKKIVEDYGSLAYMLPLDGSQLLHYEEKEIIPYSDLDKIISELSPDKIGICYIPRITQMLSVEKKAREIGLSPISIWSIRNTEHPMNSEQLAARQAILDNFEIPEQYNFLIINASSETSLKIKSRVDYVIVHCSEEDTQIQVRGRVNHDLPQLYLPATETQKGKITVPDEFLGKMLFLEDKDDLCKELNIFDKNGRLCKWHTIKEIILQQDYYQIAEGRKNNRRYAIITQILE